MVTSIFDVFLGVLEVVFVYCSLFGDDRSLPKGLALQSLPSVPLSEMFLAGLFSLAGALCVITWFSFDSLKDG